MENIYNKKINHMITLHRSLENVNINQHEELNNHNLFKEDAFERNLNINVSLHDINYSKPHKIHAAPNATSSTMKKFDFTSNIDKDIRIDSELEFQFSYIEIKKEIFPLINLVEVISLGKLGDLKVNKNDKNTKFRLWAGKEEDFSFPRRAIYLNEKELIAAAEYLLSQRKADNDDSNVLTRTKTINIAEEINVIIPNVLSSTTIMSRDKFNETMINDKFGNGAPLKTLLNILYTVPNHELSNKIDNPVKQNIIKVENQITGNASTYYFTDHEIQAALKHFLKSKG